MHYPFARGTDYYTFDQLEDFIFECVKYKVKRYKNKGIQYINIAASFDIETSSLYIDKESLQIETEETDNSIKFATMYIWHFCYNGYVIYGRTWQEFKKLLDSISSQLETDEKNCLIVYVHNLSYEFQYMRKHFQWDKVFSTDSRKPLYARTVQGIEFRDSLILSGLSLAMTAKQLHTYHCEKLVGDLDYSLIRNCKTPLSYQELSYCINDVLVVAYYIAEQIEEYKYITNIPLTNTGRVRKYVQNMCYGGKNSKHANSYQTYMKTLTINSAQEYDYMKRSFMGGFTHANINYVREEVANVASMDITSDYPFQFFNLFPMSSGEKVTITNRKQFNEYIDKYCCVFYIKFNNLRQKFINENIISSSKCIELIKPIINNGRVMYADSASMVINEIDYKSITKFYSCDSMEVGTFYIYKKGFLPLPIIDSMLTLYEQKTKLKNVEGAENYILYMRSKGMLNSLYGMMVTSIIHDIIDYADDWLPIESPDIEESLNKYNNNKGRFTFYLWGCYITSYARQMLYNAILELNDDYIYSDTDSVKFKNYDKHKAYFDKCNEQIEQKLTLICEKVLHIDSERIRPVDIKGIRHVLGTWDYEGTYKRFKTLGAKRYIYESEDGIHTTVAGIGKQALKNYLINDCKEDPFVAFDDALNVPPDKSGKLVHTYIDNEMRVSITDYLGNTCTQYELSSVHLGKTSFDLSMTAEFMRLALGMKEPDFVKT